MKEFSYVVKDPLGIHARPGGMIARIAKKYENTAVCICKGEKTAVASQLIRLISLGIHNGDSVVVQADGPEEHAAIEELHKFFEENL